jgi:hypothetical protein
MITFADVRPRSVSNMTCPFAQRRTVAHEGESHQLQAQLQPGADRRAGESPGCERAPRSGLSLNTALEASNDRPMTPSPRSRNKGLRACRDEDAEVAQLAKGTTKKRLR